MFKLSTSKTDFRESLSKNNRAYFNYFTQLSNIAMSRFEWHGLPDTVDTLFMERILYYGGKCVIFRDEVMGYLCARWTGRSSLNVYDIPVVRRAWANNGYHITLDGKNSVVFYDNQMRTAVCDFIDYQARRLWEYDRAIDINVNAQKTPLLIRCSKDLLLSLKNVYAKYAGNEPVIYADDEVFNPDNFTVLKTDAPFVGDKVQKLKSDVWNETLCYLGIPNVTYQKNERMVTDEVARMMGGTVASVESELASRLQACERLKKMFPDDFKDVTVRFKFESADKGGDTDVELHYDGQADLRQ